MAIKAKKKLDYTPEIPKGMKLGKLTKMALKKLSKHGVVVFVRDDGPEGYEAEEQLEQIAYGVGYEHIKKDNYTTIVIANGYFTVDGYEYK